MKRNRHTAGVTAQCARLEDELESLRTPPLKQQVVRELTRLIEQGSLPPGARLLGERALAERLGVGRGTVREAVQFLETLGVLEIRHGSGTYVRTGGGQPGGLSTEWRAWTTRHSGRIRDLLEIRRGLESLAVELATERSDARSLDGMRAALEQMEGALELAEIPLLVQADVAFHRAISDATKNLPLAELTDALGAQLLQERAAIFDLPDRPRRSLDEHRRIYAAIADGDPSAARDMLLAHIDSIETDLARVIAAKQDTDDDAAASRFQSAAGEARYHD
jgi:DNA-binding FadR family transcriptional regulator